MSSYATNRFAGDGVTTSYSFNFVGGYLDKSHVKAYIEDNATQVQTEIYINPLSFLTPYTLVGFAPVPVGKTLILRRETPAGPLVDFTNGSRFTELSLDRSTRQGLFLAAEAMDLVGDDGLATLAAAQAQASAVAAGASATNAAASASAAAASAGSVIGLAKIKVAVIGDSMSAQQNLGGASWPSVWQDRMAGLGVVVDMANLAVSGYTFYRANTVTTNFNGQTVVQRCAALNPDVVFVALGVNDTITHVDGRTLAQTQADATSFLAGLRAALPGAIIVMVNQHMHDSVNFATPGTTLLNKGVFPGMFAKPSSGILTNAYSAEILDTDVGATTRGRYANWLALMATCNSHPGVSVSVTLNAWRAFRLGLGGTDGVHLSAQGNVMLASYMVAVSQSAPIILAKWPAISQGTFATWSNPDTMFADTLYRSGNGWLTQSDTFASDWVAKAAGYGLTLRPDTWWAPSGGAVRLSTLNTPFNPTQPAYWEVTNARPRQPCYVSVNGAAFGAVQGATDAFGNAQFVANAAALPVGTWTLRYKVGNEVYGPYTQVITAQAQLPHLLVTRTSEVWAAANGAFVAIPYDNVINITGGGTFNTATGAYTVPVSGVYSASHIVGHQMGGNQISIAAVYVDGTSAIEGTPVHCYAGDADKYVGSTAAGTLRLTAGQTVQFYVYRTDASSGSAGKGYSPGARGRSCTASIAYLGP